MYSSFFNVQVFLSGGVPKVFHPFSFNYQKHNSFNHRLHISSTILNRRETIKLQSPPDCCWKNKTQTISSSSVEKGNKRNQSLRYPGWRREKRKKNVINGGCRFAFKKWLWSIKKQCIFWKLLLFILNFSSQFKE